MSALPKPSAQGSVPAQSAEDPSSLALRRLTREEAHAEQRLYWSRKTVAERLTASAELTRRLYLMRGIDLNESKTDLTPRRIPRRKR